MPNDSQDQDSPDSERIEDTRLELSKRWKWIPKVLYTLGAVGVVLGIPFWAEGVSFYLKWLGVLYDTFGGFEIWTWAMIVMVYVALFVIARIQRMAYSDLVDLSGRHLTTVKLLGELVGQVKLLVDRVAEIEQRLGDEEK